MRLAGEVDHAEPPSASGKPVRTMPFAMQFRVAGLRLPLLIEVALKASASPVAGLADAFRIGKIQYGVAAAAESVP